MAVPQGYADTVRRLLRVNDGLTVRFSTAIRPGEYSVHRTVLWVSAVDHPAIEAIVRDHLDRA